VGFLAFVPRIQAILFTNVYFMEIEYNITQALQLNTRAILVTAHPDAVFTTPLAALYCGISEFNIRQEANKMNIVGTKKAKFWYFRKKDLDAWMMGV
jgi:hypothetical protein